MKYLCIIFSTCRQLLEASPPDSYRGSAPEARWETSVPRPFNLPTPGKKILRSPMLVRFVYSFQLLYIADILQCLSVVFRYRSATRCSTATRRHGSDE